MNFNDLFPDNREDGSTPLRQCQLVMLRMLKVFDFLCRKHEINYFLIGGSLIGAVRHKGFIPWDDDLDVAMTRTDYEKFINCAAHELPNDVFFQNAQTDKYYSPICNVDARLRDKYSRYIHIGKKKNKHHEGFQVDIFVHDRAYLPHNFFIITQNKLLMLLKNNKKRVKVQKFIAKFSPISLVYSSNYLKKYGAIRQGTYITQKEYSKLIRVKFEDTEVFIPQGYDSYLRRQFGDYMQLPPLEKRVSAHNVIPDPFTPCDHIEILQWEKRAETNQE